MKDLLHLVMDGMGWSEPKARHWFMTPNPLLGGISPEAFEWLRGKRKLRKFIVGRLSENKPPKKK